MTNTPTQPQTLELAKIRTDGGTQARAEIDLFTVGAYADEMKEGAIFPPVVVFHDGSEHWLADGFHRVEAAIDAEFDQIAADVRQGTRRDAVLYSVGANSAHGLRRTNADKRRAVKKLLEDDEWGANSSRWVAVTARVTHPFVEKVRSEMTGNGYQSPIRQGQDGRVYDTSNIGVGMRTDTRTALDDYPEHIAKTAYKAALATVEGEHKAVTPKMAAQHADNLIEGETTGYFDGGYEGESRPVSESGSWLDTRDATERERQMRQKAHMHVLSEESVEWYTPPQYIEAARAVMGGIDLDPASNETAQGVVVATEFYTADDDGLKHPWQGRVWLNPPWGRACADFVARCLHEFEQGNVTQAVLLLNSNSNETAWFQPLWDYTLCFSRGRINFYTPDGEATGSTHGSVFVYLGPNGAEFAGVFKEYGNVVRRIA